MADREKQPGARVRKSGRGATGTPSPERKRAGSARKPQRDPGALATTRGGSRAEQTTRSGRGAARTGKVKSAARAGKKVPVPAAEARRLMRIKELDPLVTCGRGTTVTQLYRVDRLGPEPAVTHLVFFDRHGWYCEHGRECPAVAAVRKHEKRTLLTR
ncbi:MAG: hypothetical protein WKG32_02045 [Gemmatimonadaceae bacterium]